MDDRQFEETMPTNDDALRHQVDQVVKLSGVQAAVLLSADGIAKADSGAITRDDVDRVAASISGIYAGAEAILRQPGGATQQVLIHKTNMMVVAMTCGSGTRLVAITRPDADIRTIATEMKRIVRAIDSHTASAPRSEVR